MNRYILIAPIYDLLKRMVFGNALNEAAIEFIPEVSDIEDILIVGGGSGASLPSFKAHQNIDFVDSNATMIGRARKRKSKAQVRFHVSTFEAQEFDYTFDVICFPFFLDLYNVKEVKQILEKANSLLKPEGKLIVTDFYPVESLNNQWQKLVLRTVIVFFNITTWHRHSKIFNIPETLKTTNYQQVKLKQFANGMVFASLWKRAEH